MTSFQLPSNLRIGQFYRNLATFLTMTLAWASSAQLTQAQESTWLPAEGLYPLKTTRVEAPDREPDLVLEMGDTFTLPAEGDDIIRSFVIPATALDGARHIQQLELLPGNSEVVKLGIVRADSTDASRLEDEKDITPGFSWRPQLISLRQPSEMFGVWTPRAQVMEAPEGTGWRLHPQTDVVVTLHLSPNGTEQEIRPLVALWYASKPIHHLLTLRMANETIVLKPGVEEYNVRDSIVIPVPAKVYSIFPLANKLAESMRVDFYPSKSQGERLMEIPKWEANRQEVYRFEKPLEIEANTRLDMRMTFNNSGADITTAKPVEWGGRLDDELAEMYVQIAVYNEEAALLTSQAISRHQLELTIEGTELERENHVPAHVKLALLYSDYGQHEAAVSHGKKALSIAPDDADAHAALGAAYMSQNFHFSAQEHLEKAVTLNPQHASAHFNLGNVFLHYKAGEKAVHHYQLAAELTPRDSRIDNNLGLVYMSAKQFEKAIQHFDSALERNPRHVRALLNLASAWDQKGIAELTGKTPNLEKSKAAKKMAVELYQRAIKLSPGTIPLVQGRLQALGVVIESVE